MEPGDRSTNLSALGASARSSKPTQPIDLSALDALVGFNIHVLDLLMYQLFYAQFAKRSMTPGIFSTLLAIEANPGVRQGALADALMIQRSNMTILVNRLIRAGHVKRRSAKGDNRGVVLSLTGKGRHALRDAQAEIAAHERRLVTSLTARERDALLRLLKKMARDLRSAPRRNGHDRVTPG